MKEKKSNWLLVVAVILSLLVGGVVGYFISNSFLNKNDSNQTNEENQINEENNEQKQCKYTKLKEASTLTDQEKTEIYKFIIEGGLTGDTPILDEESFKTINLINNYVYDIEFYWTVSPDQVCENESGIVDCPSIGHIMLWKENEKWKGKLKDSETSWTWICNECGDCS